MSKITAEEILRTKYKLVGDRGELRIDQLVYIMQEHTKQHIEALRSELHKDFAPFVGEIIDQTINNYLENIK